MIRSLRRKIKKSFSDKSFSEILRGSTWALASRVLATGLGFISTVLVARIYGAKVTGIVALMESFLVLATIFTVLGTNTSLLRLIPEHMVKYSATSAFNVYRKSQYLVIWVSLATGGLSYIAAGTIAGGVFSKPNLAPYFSLAAIFVVFKSLMLLNTQAIRGLRLIRIYALFQILPHGSNLALLFLLGAYVGGDKVPVFSYLGGLAVTGILGWIVMDFSFRRRMNRGDSTHQVSAKTILATSLPMLLSATMSYIIGQTGVVLIGIFRSEVEAGYYSVAVKLATATTFVLVAVNSMASPKFSELHSLGNSEDLVKIAKKSAKLIFWTTTPILIGLVLLGKPILGTIFGPSFQVAYIAMVLVVIGQFVNSVSGPTTPFLNMTGRQIPLRNIMMAAACVNVGLNLALTPRLGINGAAISAMTSLVLWNLISLAYIKQKYGKYIGYIPDFGMKRLGGA